MSVNSLSNFGVPGLNGDRSAVLHPILSNRFRVLFYNFGTSGEPAPYAMTRQVRSIGRPNIEFEIVTLYNYVSTVYINTRGEWQTLNLVLRDDIINSAGRRVQNQISKQQNFFDQTIARAGENYKFEMDLDVLAGGASAGGSAADPNIIQKWCYSGCQIVTADYGEMTNDEANPVDITLTIRYDNVIGFDENGTQMGTFNIDANIASRVGVASTGVGSNSVNIVNAVASAVINALN